MRIRSLVWLIVSVVVVAAMVTGFFVVRRGFSARDEPSTVEAITARIVRRLAVPARSKSLANPVYPTDEVFAEARAHFADLTPEQLKDMERMNPKSREEIEEEREEEAFLKGGGEPPDEPPKTEPRPRHRHQ